MEAIRFSSQYDRQIEPWERLWAPYDEPTYQSVLDKILPTDVVLDIGAGDLRFARKAARISRRIYALEIRKDLINSACMIGSLPDNLIIIQGDARRLSFPPGITCGVLLMRHCTHFALYVEKLKAAGATRLFTNARWGFGVETVWLRSRGSEYSQIPLGWYACKCGQVGFKPGPVALLAGEAETKVHEVVNCPGCEPGLTAGF
jgi:hypothetical protein